MPIAMSPAVLVSEAVFVMLMMESIFGARVILARCEMACCIGAG